LAGGLFLVWVQAAFGEELVFRGFLLTRLELLLGGGLSAAATAVVGQALRRAAAGRYHSRMGDFRKRRAATVPQARSAFQIIRGHALWREFLTIPRSGLFVRTLSNLGWLHHVDISRVLGCDAELRRQSDHY
jgi:hypothetical protein